MGPKHLRALIFLLGIVLCSATNYNYVDVHEKSRLEDTIVQTIGDLLEGNGTNVAKFKDFLRGYENRATGDEDLEWIIPMFDAWGKFPSGILTGNVINSGQFDECLSIGTDYRPNKANVKGQYCGYAISVPLGDTLQMRWAVCIPHEATLPNVVIPFGSGTISITGYMCQTNGSYNKLELRDKISIGVFSGILFLIAISTIFDGYLYYTEKQSPSPLFIAFSLVTNAKKLFATSNAPGQIECLHGIRAISLMWIIAGHRYVSVSALPSTNMVQTLEFRYGSASGYIQSARAAVDTFFLFSAFLVSFIYLKGIRRAITKAEVDGKSAKNTLTWVQIPMYYIHRLLRITPALAAVFYVQITFFRRIGEGPIWPLLMNMTVETCEKWWWSLFLYVQNYVNYTDMCIVPTWYLSADMQLYILSPFLIIPLGDLYIKGKKKLAYIVMSVIIVISIVVPMTVEFFREFDPLNIYETHHRVSVYTIGILFGMIVNDFTDKKVKINPLINIALWMLSLAVMLAIVFTMYETEVTPELEKNNLYFSLTRPVWSAAVCYIVFACHFGYGGPINWFLSKPIFQVMTKLSFSMYLLHNLMITLSIGTEKTPGHFSEYETMYSWCGDYIFTIVVSIAWVLCFESPIVGIEKVIFGTGKKPQQPVTTVQKNLGVTLEAGVARDNKSLD